MLLTDAVWVNSTVASRELLALHRRMGRVPIPLLVKQVKLAFPDRDASVLESAAKELVCDACEKRKRAPNGPMVSLPKEPHFNYEVGANLWYLRGRSILHVICLFTRLGHCTVLQNKSAPDVCHALLHLWVKCYGPPVLLFTDLGRGFDNDLMRLFADKYGITLHCAPGGSHWSLGGVERHHYQLRHTVEMLLEADDTLSMNDACDVACMAANAQPMSDRGFSPQQLVYGVSAKWPDLVSADLPALSSVRLPSDHVGHYMSRFLDAMYEARAKFHAADIRAKISLAERHKPSKNRDVVLTAGDRVFYHEALENGKDTWHGPASVIGVDGDFVVVRHGGGVRRLPLLRCRLASSVLGNVDPPADDPGEELCPEDVQDVIVDEAGNELTEAEILALRDEDAGHAVEHSQRDPVMTRSRARAELGLLSRLSTDGAHMGWRRYVSVADPQASRDLLLAHCYVARKSMRKGMCEVDAQRALSPEFVMAKQKELASWDACEVYDIVDDHGQCAITC